MSSSAPIASKKNGKPTALVVGAAGFIGSYLCEILVSQNLNTFGVDNLRSGTRENIKALLPLPNFHFIEADINKTLPPLGDVDIRYIFHLAGIEEYLNNKDLNLETLIVNSLGTKNLLDLAKEHKSTLILVSSADLYFGAISSTSLKYYFGKRAKAESVLTHHEAKRYAEALAFEYYKKYSLDVRIARILDVYGPRMSLETNGPVANLINNTLKEEKMIVQGDGLRTVHPTYVSDVVFGLYKLALSDLKGQILHLVSTQKTTLTSFAEQLKKVSGEDLEITYKEDEDEVSFPYHTLEFEQTREKLNWVPKMSLSDGLTATLEYFRKPEAVEEKPILKIHEGRADEHKSNKFSLKFPNPLKKIKFEGLPRVGFVRLKGSLKKSHLRRTIGITTFSLVLLALIYPVFSLVFNGFWGGVLLKEVVKKIEQGETLQAKKKAASAEEAFSNAQYSLNNLFWLNGLGFKENSADLGLLLDSGQKSASILKRSLDSFESLDAVLKGTFGESSQSGEEIERQIKTAKSNLGASIVELGIVENNLKKVAKSSLPGFLSKKAVILREEVREKGKMVSMLGETLEILPFLIGTGGEKNYLLLFQNSTEIRPTGGFIGSYGLLSFKNGVIKELLIDDIYNPDGQLKEEITPPDPIREHLGELRWWLRDSNWNPQFSESAKQAEWFFEKETGKKVDGVLAINLGMVKELLKVTGKVKIIDFGEDIDHENLVSRALYHSEIGFFAGSTKKRDFLGSVGRVVIDKLIREKKAPAKLFQAIQESLNKKDLLVFLNEPFAQELAIRQNWDGRVRGVEEASIVSNLSPENSVADYLYVVDANLGVNKADIYIKSKIDYLVRVDKKGERVATVTLTYTHQGETDTWPGGKYKNFARVYVPEGAEIIKSEISDRRDKFRLIESADLGKRIFEFYLEVSPRSSKSVTLEYKLPGKVVLDRDQTYALLVQKQPGRGEVELNFDLETPDFFSLSKVGEKSNKNSFSVKETLYQDQIFLVDIKRQ